MTVQVELGEFEKRANQRARHRALVMQILFANPKGLTTQQVQDKEKECYGYTFLTDNRLRELRAIGWATSEKGSDGLLRWYAKSVDCSP